MKLYICQVECRAYIYTILLLMFLFSSTRELGQALFSNSFQKIAITHQTIRQANV